MVTQSNECYTQEYIVLSDNDCSPALIFEMFQQIYRVL
jgi:hypothetical protein